MDSMGRGGQAKPATAARMYDYYLGGIYNFPADREAAERIIEIFPDVPAGAAANRACLRRMVRLLAAAGVRQFLDMGSGIPTVGNVHEVAQQAAPEARVVYVDIDPVAVSESVEILTGNAFATAIRGDLRQPQRVLTHPNLRKLLDLRQPTALIFGAVLHFVPDPEAYDLVTQFMDALAPGSHLAITHAAAEAFAINADKVQASDEVYKQRTSSPAVSRSHAQTERFFTGLDLLDPGVVWSSAWRPEPCDGDPFAAEPERSGGWAGVAVKPGA